jgi:uncharacterized protein
MTFLLTSTGREHYIAGDDARMPANVPSIQEVAHSLAQINRFTGHCHRPYSVAEHSLLVADIARELYSATPVVELACLMHDAHECITGDMASPVKWVVGQRWTQFEGRHMAGVRRHFMLGSTFAAHNVMISKCDLIALATERRDLLPFTTTHNEPWPMLDTHDRRIEPWSHVCLTTLWRQQRYWSEWRDAFLERYHALQAQIAAKLAALRSTPV